MYATCRGRTVNSSARYISPLEMGRMSAAHNTPGDSLNDTWRQTQLPELRGQGKLHRTAPQGAGVPQPVNSESLLLLAVRDGGRFPGLSPNCPALVPTQHRTQDPSSIPRALVSAPPPQLTSRRSKFPVEGGRDPPWHCLLTHQVTLMRSWPAAGLLPIGPERAVLHRWGEN